MAIVKMNKFTLLAFQSVKENLLKELQIFENVHFSDLKEDDFQNMDFLTRDSSGERISIYESEIAKIKFAQEKLKPYVLKLKGLKGMMIPKEILSFDDFDSYTSTYNHNEVYEEIKVLDEELKTIKAETNKLKIENDNLKSWVNLDISYKDLEKAKSISYFIGVISKTSPDFFREEIESKYDCAYVEIISTIRDETAVLVLAPSSQNEEISTLLKNLGFSKTVLTIKDVPSVQIDANNKDIERLNTLENEVKSKIASKSDHDSKLAIAYDYYATALARAKSYENFLVSEHVIIIDGWVPKDESEELKKIITKCCKDEYYLEEAEVEKDSETVPIKLKNNGLVSSFESITTMYSLPKYNEIDPTPVFTPFYMLFFGVMVGDAGFGLVLLLISIFALKFLHLNKGTRDFMKFIFYLSFCVIGAGFIFGSFFGFPFFTPITMDDGTKKAILDSQLDIVTMMILALIIGFIQIIFGVALKGYLKLRAGKPLDALFDSGFWIIALTSGVCALLGAAGVFTDETTTISLYIFFASLVGLALTQGRDAETLGGKIGAGLYSVYGISGYVGDFVSYTRLVALSLSGAYISYSFIIMAGLIPEGILRLVFGGIILLLGSLLNLGLGALGAYVHSCRLQYVEFFSKFYEGGGKAFKPLKLMNTNIDISGRK